MTWTSGWKASGGAYSGVTLRLGPAEEQVWGDAGKPLLELLA